MHFVIICIVICLLPASSSAQNKRQTLPQVVSDNATIFRRGREFSSIAFKHDTMLLPSEKCGYIYRLKQKDKTFQLIDALPLGVLSPTAIEGLAIIGDTLFLADERIKDKSPTQQYQYVFSNANAIGLPTLIQHDCREIKNIDNDKIGTEGIAINTSNRIAYIAQEHDGVTSAVIHPFRMLQSWNWEKLNAVKYKLNDGCRITDIFFDTGSRQIICMKSCYNSTLREGYGYQVGFIDVDEKGIPGPYIDFTWYGNETLDNFLVNQSDTEKYSSNVEGITIYNDYLYFVTDNNQSPVCADIDYKGRSVKTTRIFKMPLKQLRP